MSNLPSKENLISTSIAFTPKTVGYAWKWSEQYPDWRLKKLKLDIPDLKEEMSTLLSTNFKDYHGTKYMSLLYKDDKFG